MRTIISQIFRAVRAQKKWFQKMFVPVSNFREISRTPCSIKQSNRSGRRNDRRKIVELREMLVIAWPFEDFRLCAKRAL